MNKSILRNDLKVLLGRRRISLRQLARESGVDVSSLSRFLQREKGNLNTDSLFRLWPYLYGEQTPVPLHALDQIQDVKEAISQYVARLLDELQNMKDSSHKEL